MAKHAYKINKDLSRKIVAAADHLLRGIRDKAILLVARHSLCRKSELAFFEFQDILIYAKDESIKLKPVKSKTDPHSTSQRLYLSSTAQKALID